MDSSQATPPQIQTPTAMFERDQYKGEVSILRPTPIFTMNGSEMPMKSESITPAAMWATPTSQGLRPRPATIHEGFSYSVAEPYDTLPSWDSSSIAPPQTPSQTMSRPVSMHQDFYPPPPTSTVETSTCIQARGADLGQLTGGLGAWGGQKPCEGNLDFSALDPEIGIGQAYTSDEAIPILDLRYTAAGGGTGDSIGIEGGGLNPRRMSGSSFTVSTSGGLSEMASYEDFSTALSEAPSFTSDYPPPSNRNSLMSTQLSPVASPRMTPQGRSELVRTQSRGRGASPSPRPSVRSAPYSVESNRNKRWSTGSYGGVSQRRHSPFVYHPQQDPFGPRMNSRHSSPTISTTQLPLSLANLQATQQNPYFLGSSPAFPHHSMLLPSQLPSQLPFHHHQPHPGHFEAPPPGPPLLSHGLFRLLQSNADPHSFHSHYADLSDPPDLFGSLHEEQVPPPPEDMKPSDPDLVPHEQELRFEGDLYTPRWVRGHGNKREGWCGICKPGRWLVLKNSAFWYDKSFTHGISAATGNPFQEPQETRRMDGNPDVWEGLCGSCNEWIALVSSKKKGTTWFRHAYKCHTHPKVKDAPKRRRESSHARALAASQMPRPKTDSMPSCLLQQDLQIQQQPQQQRPITPSSAAAQAMPHQQLQATPGLTPPHLLRSHPHHPPQTPLPPPPQRHSNAAAQAAAQMTMGEMPGLI